MPQCAAAAWSQLADRIEQPMIPTIIIGSGAPTWLAIPERPPLMVSRRKMPKRKLPRASSSWVLDSGGFVELSINGGWSISAAEYVAEVARYSDEIGHMDWAAPQDWMVEPSMLARTGLNIADHQQRTVDNFLELRMLAPQLPIIPVVQGWTTDDYLRCVDLYDAHGIDLRTYDVVGVGSVCRRQHTTAAVEIFRTLHALELRLHGFGLKAQGIAQGWPYMVSCDSMAWSAAARWKNGSCGRISARTKLPILKCNHCWHAALEWWEASATWPEPVQGTL